MLGIPGYVILLVAVTIICYLVFNGIEKKREDATMEGKTREERRPIKEALTRKRWSLTVRLALWTLIAAFGLFGDALGVMLMYILTIEALLKIYHMAYYACDDETTVLIVRTIPFGVFAAIIGMKYGATVLGIILGIAIVAVTLICSAIGNRTRERG